MRLILIANLGILVFLTFSCSNSARVLVDKRNSQHAEKRPTETPIPLEATKDNQGKRCEARYYFGVRSDETNEGYSPFCHDLQLRLIRAAREGNLSEIRETLKYGANPNLPVDESFPPLQIAANNGRSDAVRLLLDNGADVTSGHPIHGNPLTGAAYHGHADVIKILLARGADVCFRADGATAKDIARQRGHNDIVGLLVSVGGDKCK